MSQIDDLEIRQTFNKRFMPARSHRSRPTKMLNTISIFVTSAQSHWGAFWGAIRRKFSVKGFSNFG